MMGKKLNTLANSEDQNLSEAIRASAQQIWQAGLGAFSVAEHEGSKLFSKLVKDGVALQNRTRHLADVEIPASMSKVAANINKQASGSWGKLEKVFEDRVTHTLAQLGVPTSKDLHDLSKRVEQLSLQIAKLDPSAATPTVTISKSPVKKVAARKSAAKAMPRIAATKAGAAKERPSAR